MDPHRALGCCIHLHYSIDICVDVLGGLVDAQPVVKFILSSHVYSYVQNADMIQLQKPE